MDAILARSARLILPGYVALFLVFLYLPILLLLVLSFNDSQVIGLPFRGFSLQWYRIVFGTPAILHAIGNSMLLGIASAAIATALALLLAMGFRHAFPGKALLMQVILLPILIPGIVGGIVTLVFFGYAAIPFGLWTTALPTHVTWVLPFAFLTLFPRLHGFDRSVEEAAMDLGATPFMVFHRVVFPMIRPGVVSTAMFAFTLSFDEFIRTVFIIGSDDTVPVHLWSLLTHEMAPFLPAVGVVVMAVSVVVSLAGHAVTTRANRASSLSRGESR